MSTRRRRRGEEGGRRTPEGDGRRPSRTGTLRKSRQERKTRTTIIVLAMAVLCVPLVLWIYPKITTGTVLSRLANAQIAIRAHTATQITELDRSNEAADDGTYSVHVSCEVYNGTTKPVTGVAVTLAALDEDGKVVVEQTAEPAGFGLDGRVSQSVAVSLVGLTRQQVDRIASLNLNVRYDE